MNALMQQREYVKAMAQITEMQQTLIKAAGASMSAQHLHGGVGLFNTPGLENEVLNTVVRPRGLASILPAFPTLDTNPQYGIIGGISDDVGGEPVNVCDAAPTGTILVGTLTAKFGRVIRDTKTIDIGEVNLRLNRGDFTDLMMIGSVLNPDNAGLFYPSDIQGTDLISSITQMEMVNAGVRLERKLSAMLWYGDPANNTTSGYWEFPGLAVQLVTGQIDADDGATALPTVDPLVIDALFANVDAYDLVGVISAAEQYVYELAEDTLGGMTGAFCMNGNMWQLVSQNWPIQYNTQSVATLLDGADASRVFIDGRINIQERDQMRASKRLTVNGRDYPVVTDSGLHLVGNTEDAVNVPVGSYASSIFFIPLTFRGNTPATFLQYVDFRAAVSDIGQLNNREDFWTDSGRFFWAYESNNFCYKLKARVEPRVVCRTPQLSFRIDNLLMTPAQLHRAALPGEPGYVSGGRAAGVDRSATNAVWA